MIRKFSTAIALGTCLAALQLATAPATSAKELKVISEKTVTGFEHVESVAYDPKRKVFYTSDFGPDLKPADKDGKGKITKVSADGKILEDGFLPAKGQVLNKPKGLWIKGDRLWARLYSVWVFDLKTKEGKNSSCLEPPTSGDLGQRVRRERQLRQVPLDGGTQLKSRPIRGAHIERYSPTVSIRTKAARC